MSRGADLVITGADVYTVDAARRWADTVAIRDEVIVAVGTEAEVRERVGRAARHLHLPGRMVLPGFQDAHIHAPFAGRNRLRVNLDGLGSKAAYLEHIARYAAEHPQEPWIIGGGWAMEHFAGGEPHRRDLDAVVPDRPVFLFNRDVHGAWINTAALRLAGIDARTPDPADGQIVRDPGSGEATGSLHEGAAYRVNDEVVPAPDRSEWEASIIEAQQHLYSLGITGWQDAWVTPATLEAYLSLAESGQLGARVVGALWWDRNRGLEQVPDLVDQRRQGESGAPRFHPTTVKIMIDGVLETQSGAVLEPYCDGHGGQTDHNGLMFVEPALLAEAVTTLDGLGFQVHMHAIGDAALRHALDAVERARTVNGRRDNRHHIAHLQLAQPPDLWRFRDLGVVANCQTYWAQSEPQMEELTVPLLGPERAGLQYPFADLARSGAVLAMGSDWGVTTANPLEQIEVAVTRIDPENRTNAPFLPEQRLPLPAAVAAFTIGSAYVNHDDASAGTIEVGKRADLAILDRNVFTNGAGHVADSHVEYTFVRGQAVYERD
jgi:predicted amidohydrolase YtcJ